MFGWGSWQQIEDNEDGTEVHELIISKEEVEQESEDDSESKYLVQRISKKANRLGVEGRKIINVEYRKDSDGDWIVRYVCEKDWI